MKTGTHVHYTLCLKNEYKIFCDYWLALINGQNMEICQPVKTHCKSLSCPPPPHTHTGYLQPQGTSCHSQYILPPPKYRMISGITHVSH